MGAGVRVERSARLVVARAGQLVNCGYVAGGRNPLVVTNELATVWFCALSAPLKPHARVGETKGTSVPKTS